MRGGFLHNQVLLEPLTAYFRTLGAQIHREHPTGPGREAGFVDLFIILDSWRIVCEAELTPTRAINDFHKALILRANLLVIVVPQRRVAHAIQRRLEMEQVSPELRIYVGTLAVARQVLAQIFTIKVSAECPSDINT